MLQPKRVPRPDVPDVGKQNLPPEQELSALLAGEERAGLLRGGVRVAVTPFEVVGGNPAWIGEAASELLSAGLSHVDGVWVLEREKLDNVVDELKRGDERDNVKKSGSILGAQFLVVGKVTPRGDGGDVIATPVRVRDGVRRPSVRFALEGNDWTQVGLDGTARILGELGIKTSEATAESLPPDALRAATEARERLYRGELLEAEPLFANALGDGTTAWRYEADYLHLMNRLGMWEWVTDRAERLLDEIPKTGETACNRAQILTHLAESDRSVPRARRAVQAAASCGDPTAVAEALIGYAWAIEPVHFPLALESLERAVKALGDQEHGYTRCLVEFRQIWLRSKGGLDEQGGVAKRYLDVAKKCEDGGNRSFAALAINNAAHHTNNNIEAAKLHRQALELAQSVGGRRVSGIEIDLAEKLRALGQLQKSDEMLLAGMRRRLERIAQIGDGLPDAERRLPADLLRRVGIASVHPAKRTPDRAQKLLLEAHRRSLARYLEGWATRTERTISTAGARAQAATYRALARQLSGADDPLSGIERHKRVLDKAQLSLEQIESGDQPLHADAPDLRDVVDALWGWFFAIDRKKDVKLAGRLASASRKVAGWLASPRARYLAERMTALEAKARGDAGQAVEILRKAEGLIVDAPWAVDGLLLNLSQVGSSVDRKAANAARLRRVEVSKRRSNAAQVEALYRWGLGAMDLSQKDARSALKQLSEAVVRFERQKLFADAALAITKVASLNDSMRHARGSRDAISLYRRRARLLENLNDPLRVLNAHVDTLNQYWGAYSYSYGGGVWKALRDDPAVTSLVARVERATEDLAQRGNFRDAARLISRLPGDLPRRKELTEKGLRWAAEFQNSKEYAPLAALLYYKLGRATRNAAEARGYFQRSRKLYAKAGNQAAAISQISEVVKKGVEEGETVQLVNECIDLATTPWQEVSCLASVAIRIIDRGSWKPKARGPFRAWTRRMVELLPMVDREAGAQYRYGYRTRVAAVAAMAGDRETAVRMKNAVVKYYSTTKREPYQVAMIIARTARAATHTMPELSVDLYGDFFKTFGSSDYWRTQEYVKAAVAADLAGDRDAEKEFLERGRKLLERHKTEFYGYAMYEVRRALRRNERKKLPAAYRKAESLTKKFYPRYHQALRGLAMSRAASLAADRRNATAFRAIKPFVTEAVDEMKGRGTLRSPCQKSALLELAASIKYASGACKAGDELRNNAKRLRSRCNDRNRCGRTANGKEWCDETDGYRLQNECRSKFVSDDAIMLQ